MRYLSKYISAALMLILAVACNTKEIDNPDNPDKPQISDNIKIAASIKQTRVSYSVDNNKLVPDWEKDDVIFGYYGTGDGRIVFTVTDVDETTGIASLEATSESDWGDFLAEYKTAGKDLKVGLIYTGTKKTDKDILFANGNSVSVTMTSQTGENIPACMHATSFDPDKDDEGQIIRFLFDNDCAIFEVESLTGIAEDAGLGENETLKLKSLTVTNLIPTYEYSYASGELSGKSGTVTLESYTITLPENTENTENTWQVDYEGNINRTDAKKLLIAVAPNSVKNDILITATVEDGREFSYLYYGNLDAGECYRIKKRDVVAKTSDNQYFTSVKAAFDHASTLSSTYEDDNTVTLVKEEIYGLLEDAPNHDTKIDPLTRIGIDYPVTLDLNGCTLDLDYDTELDAYNRGGFIVSGTDGHLILKDGAGGGRIQSVSYCPIIDNSGTLEIQGGYLINWERIGPDGKLSPVIRNSKKLKISEGSMYSYYGSAIESSGTNAEVTITGGDIGNASDSKETIQVLDGTQCVISGGVIYSEDDISTIACRSKVGKAKLTVKWPNDEQPTELSAGTGPIIYAIGAYHWSTAPISVEYANVDLSTAVVQIQGGYLISSNDVFYTNNDDSYTANNLDLSTFGDFYSNVYKIQKDGDNYNMSNIPGNYYDLLEGVSLKTGFSSKAEFLGEDTGFYISVIDYNTGDLYKITTTAVISD